jgi:hypothetical protein
VFNLLTTALRLIPPVQIEYQVYNGSQLNSFGIEVNSYSDSVIVKKAHIQPLKAEMYADYGLQPSQNVKVCYIPANVIGTLNKSSNDIIIYNNKRFNIVNTHEWFTYNGWNKLIIIEEKNYEI